MTDETWYSDFKTAVGTTIARAVVCEDEPRRFHIDVKAGRLSPPTEFASSIEEAKRRAEDMVLAIWPGATAVGWQTQQVP